MQTVAPVDAHTGPRQSSSRSAGSRVAAQINYRVDTNVVGQQVGRGCIAFVVGGKHDGRLHGLHRETIYQALRSGREHHAGQVIVVKNTWLLEYAGGDDYGTRAHLGYAAVLD
jgi:hypothetical protein